MEWNGCELFLLHEGVSAVSRCRWNIARKIKSITGMTSNSQPKLAFCAKPHLALQARLPLFSSQQGPSDRVKHPLPQVREVLQPASSKCLACFISIAHSPATCLPPIVIHVQAEGTSVSVDSRIYFLRNQILCSPLEVPEAVAGWIFFLYLDSNFPRQITWPMYCIEAADD